MEIIRRDKKRNVTEVKIDKIWYKTKEKYLEEELYLKFGIIAFFKQFPFKKDNYISEEINLRDHYFTIVGISNKNIYLAYMTTKIDKYKTKLKNNNYVVFYTDNKDILISSKKIYAISKNDFKKELKRKHCLVNKRLNSSARKILWQLFENSEHLTKGFKKKMKDIYVIKRKKISYPLAKNELKNRKKSKEIATLVIDYAFNCLY